HQIADSILPRHKPAAASRITARPFTYPDFSLERPLVEQQVGPAIAAEIAGHNLIPGVAPAVLHLQLRQIAIAEAAIELTPAGGAIVEEQIRCAAVGEVACQNERPTRSPAVVYLHLGNAALAVGLVELSMPRRPLVEEEISMPIAAEVPRHDQIPA